MGEKCVLSEFGLSKLHLIENQKVVFSLYIMFIYVIYNNTQRGASHHYFSYFAVLPKTVLLNSGTSSVVE